MPDAKLRIFSTHNSMNSMNCNKNNSLFIPPPKKNATVKNILAKIFSLKKMIVIKEKNIISFLKFFKI